MAKKQEDNWQEVKLGDVCSIIDGDRGVNYPKENELQKNGHCLFLNTKNVPNSKFDFSECSFISKEKDEILRKGKIQYGDIVVTTRGTLANFAYYSKACKFENVRINSGMVILRNEKQAIYTPYLCYFLMSNNFKQQVIMFATGSAQPQLPIKDMKNITISLPPLDIQKKIAGVLGALDDKIELNNKINQNLETQAQALFKSWFVDFEPFGGKMPSNWVKKSLDQFCKIFTGKKNANEYNPNGKNLFFTCAPEPLQIDSYIYDGSAIIIAGNGAYTGRTRFYTGKFDLYQRTYACTLLPEVKQDYIYLLYIMVKSLLQEKIMGGTHGSAIPYIVMNDISKFNFMYNEDVFDKLSPILKYYIEKILINEHENTQLAELRDTLLPKLMSGEINVDDVKID